jgi:hypothetical protein
MESVENEIRDILEVGIPCWLKTGFQPPNRKQSEKNSSMIQMMLAAMFHHKFPEYDPEFAIAWIPMEKQYRVAITKINKHERSEQEK